MPQALHRQLREERHALLTQASALAQKPNCTKEERARATAMLDQADVMTRQIDQLEARPSAINGGPVHGDMPIRNENREHRSAFDSYLRLGRNEMPAEQRALMDREYRDLGTGGQGAYPGATSGFFAPVGFNYKIQEALKFYGPMLNGGAGFPRIEDTATGAPLPFPASDDTGNQGELVNEAQQVTSADMSITQVMMSSFKYSSKLVKVSLELLQDSAFDLEAYLVREFSIRLGRILNNHLTLGVGTTQPLGIVPAIVAGGNIVQAIGSSSNDGTAASTNTIGSDDLVNLEHSVDPLYRTGAMYMMHDTTLRNLKKVKDKYGRPLYQESTRDGAPETLNGYRFCINNDMDAAQSSGPNSPPTVKKTVIFGQLPLYVVRRVKDIGVLVLRERFADFGQTAYLAFARYDGNSLDIGHRGLALLETTF